ncbi:hypothetical protein ACTXT7_009705 [Hymenolepis weldensis]
MTQLFGESLLTYESEAVYGSNNGHPSESRLDLKRRTILRFQNFDLLIKPLEPIRSNSEDGSIPCENGDVEVSGLRLKTAQIAGKSRP